MSYNQSILKKKIKLIIKLIKILFTPVAFLFLGYFVWRSKEDLMMLFLDASIFWFMISIILWMLLHFISPVFTKVIFKSYGVSLDYLSIFSIHVARLPAKYLPGGIWNTVARTNDINNDIEIMRNFLAKCWFHEKNCAL